jgi:S1-C subfamily serine protease
MTGNLRSAAATLVVALCVASNLWAAAADSWDELDKRVAKNVYRVNVGMRVKIKDNQFAQLADLSPRLHYPVFATTSEDNGFRVIGSGSCFSVKTSNSNGTYFLTNKHVVDYGEGMVQECARFFASTRLLAERTAGFGPVEDRYKQILRVINLSTKKNLSGTERAMYQATADSVWDTYDKHLSLKADPNRAEFRKQLAAIAFEGSSGFFLHSTGPSSQPSFPAQLYRKARTDMEPDLAVLSAKPKLPSLELEPTAPRLGDVVQAIGFPVIKQSGVSVPPSYEPAFTTGRVKEVVPQLIQFEAPVSKGDSGGPLINDKGRVVGVVVRRGLRENTAAGNQSEQSAPAKFASAVSVAAVKAFAPELFGAPKTR